MSDRRFRCVGCGELRQASTSTGPLPSTCDVCDPEAAARRRERRREQRVRARAAARELFALRDRVRMLEHALEGQRAECARRRAEAGLTACGCDREYSALPLTNPADEVCTRPVVVV